jgi:pimeloyl-ACP methyl ester carboxylesterase
MGSSLREWETLTPDLHAHGFQTFALDLLGHGDSLKPADPQGYHIQAYVEHMEAWVQGLELETPFPILAHSMGSYIALQYILRHPEMVSRLVMVDPFYNQEQLSLLLKLAIRKPGFSASVLEAVPLWVLEPLMKINPNVAANLNFKLVHRMALDMTRTHPYTVYTAPTMEDFTPHLEEIQQETLVIWGEMDMTLSPGSFPSLVERLPNAKGFSIPWTGHTPHLTKSKLVKEQIFLFLQAPCQAGEAV